MPRIPLRRSSRVVLSCGAALLWTVGAWAADAPPPSGPVEPAAHSEDDLAQRVRIVERATSSRTARDQAVRQLPLGNLPAADRRRVEEIVREVSLYRQLPAVAFEAEPEVCRFFLDHPEVAVSIWRVMEISEFRLTPTAERRYDAADRDGTKGTIDVLYHTDQETLAVCEGVYRGPLIKNGIQARALFHLKTESAAGAGGRQVVTSRLQMFVAFPSATVETVAKIVSPVSNLIVDRNFREVGTFVCLMSTAMERQPGWVEHLSGKLQDLPEARREELLKLTARIYIAARQREVAETQTPGRRG